MLLHVPSALTTTLWLMAACAVAACTLITAKARQFRRARTANRRYELAFRAAPDVWAVSDSANKCSGYSRVAGVGLGVLRQAARRTSDPERQQSLQCNLRRQVVFEQHMLESGLALLGSVARAAPFLGLLGTVWALTASLSELARLGHVSLEATGPVGAFMSTALAGIAIAVPSMIALHFFTRQVTLLTTELEDFADAFVDRVMREESHRTRAAAGSRRSSAPPRAPGSRHLQAVVLQWRNTSA